MARYFTVFLLFLLPLTVFAFPVKETYIAPSPVFSVAPMVRVVREKTISEKIIEELGESFIEISKCESGVRQYDENGTVLRGKVNPKDVGLFQISETYWLDDANKLGYNIYEVEGNISMTKYIYEKQGFEAWRASNSCHKLLPLR